MTSLFWKTCIFSLFEYLSLLINKAKVFLSNYSIHRSITQLLKYLIAAALRGPITCIEWFLLKSEYITMQLKKHWCGFSQYFAANISE